MTKHEAPSTLIATSAPANVTGDLALENREHLKVLAHDIAKQFSQDTISPAMVTGILRMVDVLLIALAGIVCYTAYVGHGPLLLFYYSISIVGGLIGMALLEINGAYQMPNQRREKSSDILRKKPIMAIPANAPPSTVKILPKLESGVRSTFIW